MLVSGDLDFLQFEIQRRVRQLKTQLKMTTFPAPNISEGGGSPGVSANHSWGDTKVSIPRSWILHDDVAEVTTLHVQLPGCNKDRISVKLWNSRHLLVDAVCEFQRYEFQYKIPLGARLLGSPAFASQNETFTCRFKAQTPACISCHLSSPPLPIETKDEFARKFKGFEFVQPHHSIISDGTMAFFKAHLEGCKRISQINFDIANNKVVMLASLSPQQYYFVSLRLESSAQCDWVASFNPKTETFTCNIPLLGHYECGNCMAKRHHTSEGSSKENQEKGAEGKNARYTGYLRPTLGQEIHQGPCYETATVTDNLEISSDLVYLTGEQKSCEKVALYKETSV